MDELDETKLLVGLMKLQTIVVDLAESQKRTEANLQQLSIKLQELVVVVHDLGVIVRSHEQRLNEFEGA